MAELYTQGGFAPDTAPAPVPLADFLAEPGNATSVLVEPDSRLEALVPHLARLERIVIRFPKFNDGRGYSLAARLRLHHGYVGVLRASGDVLTDQIQYFFRQGFDELEVSHGPTLKRLHENPAPVHTLFGQADVRGREAAPAAGHAYSWRRAGS
jgi:phosphoadenosine phosphosulfate reductase